MSQWPNYLFVFLGLLGGFVMWASQVTPRQAVSNASEWSATFGFKKQPHWLKSENADRVIRHIGAALLVGCILAGLFQFFGLGDADLGLRVLFLLGCIGAVGSIAWSLLFPSSPLTPSHLAAIGMAVAVGALAWQFLRSAPSAATAPAQRAATVAPPAAPMQISTLAPPPSAYLREKAGKLVAPDGPLSKIHAVLTARLMPLLDPFQGRMQAVQETNLGNDDYAPELAKVKKFQTDLYAAQQALKDTLKSLSFFKEDLDKIVILNGQYQEIENNLSSALSNIIEHLQLFSETKPQPVPRFNSIIRSDAKRTEEALITYEGWAAKTLATLNSEKQRLEAMAQ